ncbi:COQ9 family protein [Roseomonas eburnea]|uniref:COQ9 family protein n=1 Tax=Neoroseomonas eburnea TaxID=1346889 RepID=A0A9X9XIQ9_9PROT|nr:COQ9 family protein [Neoroseomonas eburnea]MBR0683595.1 COQ9 family protein [Neoroseomonas eburnea]
MTNPTEHADRASRDAVIRALLPLVPARGWTGRAIAAALHEAGLPEEEAIFLFPRGAVSAVEAWLDLADREMAEAAGELSGLRTPDRIRSLIATRLRQATPHKDAVRQAVALLALPWHAPTALRTAGRTVSAMWYAAGDTSADFSWYTRRATLAAVYGATLAFWLRDDSEDLGPTLDFLDRRLADVARVGRCRRRATKVQAA